MKSKLKVLLPFVLGASILALSGCGSDGAQDKDVTEPTDSNKPTKIETVTTEKAVELLKAVDCSAGDEFAASQENENWRSELRRYDGEKIVAIGYCVTDNSGEARVKQFTGDIATITRILATPDEVADPDNPAVCTMQYESQPNLWLVTDAGEVFVPRWPLDVCTHLQKPKPNELFTEENLSAL